MDAHRALQSLNRLSKKHKSIRLSEIILHLKGSLEPIFIGLLSIPFLSFFVIPGLASIFGIIIAINGVRIAQQKGIYLPKLLGKIKIPSWMLHRCVQSILRHSSRHAHTRISPPNSLLTLKWLSGWLICFSGALLAAPLPPGTNIPPAIALLLIAIGLYRHSFAWVFAGGGVFVLSMSAFILFLGWSVEAIHRDWPLWSQKF